MILRDPRTSLAQRMGLGPRRVWLPGDDRPARLTMRRGSRPAVLTPKGSAASADGDADFGSVGALLHLDGTNGGTSFPDVKGNTWTRNVVTTTTAHSKFGGASADFTATGARLQTTSAAWFDFAAGDFVIEAWCKKAAGTGTGDEHLFDAWSGRFLFRYRNGAPQLYVSGIGTPLLSFSATISSTAFVHVAVVRYGNVWTVYFDGVSVASTTASGTMSSTAANFTLGNSNTGSDTFGGYIDEFRVTKGVARYTAAFTPPTAAFPDA